MEHTVKKVLTYSFSPSEMKELSQELANKNLELQRNENAKKSIVSDYASRITACKEAISLLSNNVAQGYEMREVTCEVRYHEPDRNMKLTTRLDTNESWTEPMTDADFTLFTQWQEAEVESESEFDDDK
jgi:hypothetical protein